MFSFCTRKMDEKGQWQRGGGYAFGGQGDFDRERWSSPSLHRFATSQGCYEIVHPIPIPNRTPIPIPYSLCFVPHPSFLVPKPLSLCSFLFCLYRITAVQFALLPKIAWPIGLMKNLTVKDWWKEKRDDKNQNLVLVCLCWVSWERQRIGSQPLQR